MKVISSQQDLAISTPSLTSGGFFGNTDLLFSMRGQSPFTDTLNNIVTVPVYLNEIAALSPTIAELYDLDSVQVLRGVQGTLFGEQSNGGAVLLTSRKPDSTLNGYLEGQLGNLNDHELQGAVGIPILGDILSVRLAGDIVSRSGYTHVLNEGNFDLDNKDSDAFRISLHFAPTSAISNDVIFDYTNIHQHLGSTFLLAASPTGLASGILSPSDPAYEAFLAARPDIAALPGVAGGLQSYLSTVSALGPRSLYLEQPTSSLLFHDRIDVLQDLFKADLGPVTIRNLFGYQDENRVGGYQGDGTPLEILVDGPTIDFPSIPTDTVYNRHQISEELQIGGKLFDNRFEWLVGGYYQHLHDDTPGNAYQGVVFPFFGSGTYTPTAFDTTSKAIYTHETFAITNQLHISAGVRSTWDTTNSQGYLFTIPYSAGGLVDGPPTCEGTNIPASLTAPACIGPAYHVNSSGINWTAGLDYDVTSGLMAYVKASRGYQPGGVNTVQTIPFLATYEPESLIEYEAGLKATGNVAGVAALFNLAVYRQDIADKQVEYLVFNPVDGRPENYVINPAKSTVTGVEAEGKLVFNRYFNISAFGDYTDARYVTFQIPNIVVDPSAPGGVEVVSYTNAAGNPFPNVPRYNLGATAEVSVPIPENLGTSLSVAATYYYRDRLILSADYAAEPQGVAPGYGMVNFNVEWLNFYNKNVDVSLFCKNCTNVTYINGGISIEAELGITPVDYGEPRTYGVRVRYHF
jgi:iron complex outermembrane receptor protein